MYQCSDKLILNYFYHYSYLVEVNISIFSFSLNIIWENLLNFKLNAIFENEIYVILVPSKKQIENNCPLNPFIYCSFSNQITDSKLSSMTQKQLVNNTAHEIFRLVYVVNVTFLSLSVVLCIGVSVNIQN